MDDRRFDDLIRSLSLRLPRRSLGPLGAGLLAALGAPDADAGRRRRDDDRRREDRDRPDPDGPGGAKKKKKPCIPAGSACASAASGTKKKKPKPCCVGLTCRDGACAGSGGLCPGDQKPCNGNCVPQSVCCPACGPVTASAAVPTDAAERARTSARRNGIRPGSATRPPTSAAGLSRA